MKTAASIAVLAVVTVLVGGLGIAEADTIGLTTDKSTYTSNDEFVVVSGKLDSFKEESMTYIQLFPPNTDNYMVKQKGYPDSNGLFSVKFSTSEFDESGRYTIASSDQSDGTNQFTSFEFTNERPEFIPSPEQIASINPVAEIEKRVEDLEIKNKQLLTENNELKNQIDNLNKRIEGLMSIVQEQLKVMMKHFQ